MRCKMEKIDSIPFIASKDVSVSKIGLGFEKLDRDVFDPEKAYGYVAATGAKWIRLQSGWARTEKEKGVYDFAWLDTIVDTLCANGHIPWLCLCYGNGLYDEDAAKIFGAVGCPPIKTEEQKAAWYKYVVATVRRYHGKIDHFEVWNEPDGIWCWKHGVSGREYGEFVSVTADAIKEGNPDAKVIAGSMCLLDLHWLTEVAETGCLANVWGFTYHCYTTDEGNNPDKVRVLRAFLAKYNPAIKVIQGESGSQSRSDGAGALNGVDWTEEKQAKQLLRHSVSDLLCEVEFMSFFSCMDMIEALNGKVGDKSSYLDYGYFGILGAQFDADGRSTGEYTPKPSYYAFCNLASIFRENPDVIEFPYAVFSESSQLMNWKRSASYNEVTCGMFARPNGARAFVYWKPTDLITTSTYETLSIDFGDTPTLPVLADPMTGDIFELDEKMVERKDSLTIALHNIPLRDYPLFLIWGDWFLKMRNAK